MAMAKLHVATKRFELTPVDEHEISRHVERLNPRLKRIDPDLVNINLEIEWDPRLNEFRGSTRLTIFNEALPARFNSGPTVEAFLNRAFEDIEEQLERFKSKLRRAYKYERKRTSLPPEAAQYQERQLLDERELLDRALSGDRSAFDELMNVERPGLSAVIARSLEESGYDSTQVNVDQIMTDTFAIAFRDLARKPARWSMGGWLAWIARREIDRLLSQQAVAQSYEEPTA
jgi:ribosome-associated translation inhibitor RaiA